MPMPPKVKSGNIWFEDGAYMSIRPNHEEQSLSYIYWSPPDVAGIRHIVSKNNDVPGVWSALMAVAVMAQVEEKDES